VILIHYDIWHKGTANKSEINRYMFKFQYVRMQEPDKPSWNCQSIQWPIKQMDLFKEGDAELMLPVWINIWNWMRGAKNTEKLEKIISPEEMAENLKLLLLPEAEDESRRLYAAYTLGAQGPDALNYLLEAFSKGSEVTMRNAGFGLVAIGAAAVPELVHILVNSKNDLLQQFAAFFLGELSLQSTSTLKALANALLHAGNYTRRCCAEALGKLSVNEIAINALIQASNDPDELIRQYAVLSIAKIACNTANLQNYIPELKQILITESNRYVVAYALYALKSMKHPEADKILLEYLWTARYCPFTNNYSTF